MTFVTPSASIRSSATSGSHFRMNTSVPPKYAWVTRIEWHPVAWNSGTGTSSTDDPDDVPPGRGPGPEPERSELRAPTYMRLVRFVQMLRWVPSTPFGRPCVPDV